MFTSFTLQSVVSVCRTPPQLEASEFHERSFTADPKGSNYTNNVTLPIGCFKCTRKQNDQCKIISEKVKFFIAEILIVFTRQHANCKSKNAIYLVTCNKCKVQYVGSTSNEFKVRLRNHKSALSSKKTTCEVAVHFNKEKHLLAVVTPQTFHLGKS